MPAPILRRGEPAKPSAYPPTSRPWLHRRLRWLFALSTLLALYFFLPTHPSQQHSSLQLPSLRYKSIDWTRYAYSQFATSSAYLCNSVMVFESLSRLGSKADRILLYPEEWDTEIANSTDRDSQLLVKARDEYGVKLIPVEMQLLNDDTWNSSFTKFLAFAQTQYERVLHLDSDVTVLRHLDDLFLLPPAPVVMLRAYWALPNVRSLTSLFILLKPSEAEFERLMDAARGDVRKEGEYDMEILNRFYGDTAMVLPHQQLGLLSGEFRAEDHGNFLGNDHETWDPERVFEEASLVHFSDWPLPKPWIMWPHNLIGDMTPKCKHRVDEHGEGDCRDRKVWLGLYNDFRKRRKEICALLSAPAPEWPPRDGRLDMAAPNGTQS